MESINGPIASYQTNQNLAGAVAQSNESQSVNDHDSDQTTEESNLVNISDKRQIFNWLAQAFPIHEQASASISRMSQNLFDFQILSLSDLNKVNELVVENPNQPLLPIIEEHWKESDSYSVKQQLGHIRQVFSTLEAAQLRPVV